MQSFHHIGSYEDGQIVGIDMDSRAVSDELGMELKIEGYDV